MPRYFFHIHDGVNRPDEEGTELAVPDEARSGAVVLLGAMLKDLDGKFWAGQEWRMTVEDEQGTRVCVLNVNGQSF